MPVRSLSQEEFSQQLLVLVLCFIDTPCYRWGPQRGRERERERTRERRKGKKGKGERRCSKRPVDTPRRGVYLSAKTAKREEGEGRGRMGTKVPTDSNES